MLKQLFRPSPKWQSPKSQRRIEAIAEFQPEQPADLEILTKMAREDSEPAVRREAVRKLYDLELLSQIQRRDLEAMVRDMAGTRINELLAGKCRFSPELDTRLERIRKLQSPQVLCYLIKEAQPIDVKIAAVEQLNDEIYLEEIALRSSIARLRLTAVERISNPKILENIADESRSSDKSVYRIARDKLNAIGSLEKEKQDTAEKLTNLCEAMEAHARSALSPLYGAKAESLLQHWQALAAQADAMLAERFETAYDISQRVLAEQEEQAEQAKLQAQALIEQQASCEVLEGALAELKAAPDAFDAPALAALIKTQTLRWEVASEAVTPAAAQGERFQRSLERLQQAQALMEEVQEKRELLEATILDVRNDEAALPALSSLVESLPANPGLPLPSLLKMAHGLLATQAQAPLPSATTPAEDMEKHHKLRQMLDQLEAAINDGNSKQASRQLREANNFVREHHIYDARIGTLVSRLQELKDWAKYAVLPKKQDLLQRMEQLIDKAMDPDEKADTIKLMHDEWKALGVNDPQTEQPLWDQFKALSDRAYEPCREHFNAQRELRQQNLSKRQAICAELEVYLASPPATIDAKLLTALIRTAKTEWQQHFPVERQFAQQTQQRFNKILKRLDTLLRDEENRHEATKRALISEVTALLTHTDSKAACDKAKQLQQQWKSLGSAGQKTDQTLWKEFRTACDVLFAQRESQFLARKTAREESTQQAQDLTAAMEKLAEEALQGKTDNAASEQLQDAFRALNLPREQQQALRKRFDNAHKTLEQNARLAKSRKHELALNQFIAAFAACGEQEAALHAGNTMNTAPGETRLVSPWNEILKARTDAIQALQADAAALAAWGQTTGGNSAKAEALCLELEILLDIPSPESAKAARLQRQMDLLQKKTFQRGMDQRTAAAKDQLKALLALALPDAAVHRGLMERLGDILKSGQIRVI